MKLLHIIDSLDRGGAETLLLNTIEGFEKYYPDVEQFVLTLYDKGVLKNSLSSKVKYASLNWKKKEIFFSIRFIRKYIRDNGIKIIHTHLLHSTFISRVSINKRVGFVSTYHSVFYDKEMVTYAKKEKIIDNITYKKRYFTIFVSNAVKENIMKNVRIKSNYKVLLNFASPTFYFKYAIADISRKELKIIMVGNLHEIKNHAFAINALKALENKDITIDIYGEGPLRKELELLIKITNVKVELKGAIEMTSEILSNYDLFLMTSLHEGMPISLLEALQTGMPVLLSDIPTLRETAGDAGLYYDQNNLGSLSNMILLLFNDRNLLRKMSEQSLERSKKYSAREYVSQLYSIYHQLALVD